MTKPICIFVYIGMLASFRRLKYYHLPFPNILKLPLPSLPPLQPPSFLVSHLLLSLVKLIYLRFGVPEHNFCLLPLLSCPWVVRWQQLLHHYIMTSPSKKNKQRIVLKRKYLIDDQSKASKHYK